MTVNGKLIKNKDQCFMYWIQTDKKELLYLYRSMSLP